MRPTLPECPNAIRDIGRYSVILPPRPPESIPPVRVPTPPPGKRERITERPPRP